MLNETTREVRRVRMETRLRRLTVQQVQRVAPNMVRLSLAGDELAGFVSHGFDDHVKIFVPPAAGAALVLPGIGPDGPTYPEGAAKPAMRDYTPRRYDAAAGLLYVDFVIHEAGPATAWAAQVKPGDIVGVGGPRGSMIIPMEFDWHLLIGDETALPAIGRRLEELPATTRAVVVAEVDNENDQQSLQSAAAVQIVWVHRNGAEAGSADLLLAALRSLAFPKGEYFAWVAAEATAARAIRKHLIEERGANRHWVKAAGYWRRGAEGAHENIQD
jgi:NADPH-dependent ferric siderophore reductase